MRCDTSHIYHACTHMLGCYLREGAGHWVQQEQSEQMSEVLIAFLEQAQVVRRG